MNSEHSTLNNTIQRMIDESRQLESQSARVSTTRNSFTLIASPTPLDCIQIKAQHDEVDRQVSQLLSQVGEKKKAQTAALEELAGMDKLLTTMKEQKAKFAKALDKKSVSEIKRIVSQGRNPAVNEGGLQILDHLCQFLCKNTSATFNREGLDIFATHETLAKAIKVVEPSFHEKAWLRDVADSVNMDAEGNKGKLLEQVTNPERAEAMIVFFPYFKLLFKFCQLGMTLKTKESLIRKQKAATEETERVGVELKTLEDMRSNLKFYERI